MTSRSAVHRLTTMGLVWALGGACTPESVRMSDEPEPFSDVRGSEGVRPPRPSAGAGGASGGSFIRPAVSAAKAPPPISGGSLLMLADGKTAFAADPDRDVLYLVDLHKEALLATLPLQPGDEPGRAVSDAKGAVHVVLRRGGAVVTVNPVTAAIEQRRTVCPAPRGIAHDIATNTLYVACAGGELVTLPTTGDGPLRTIKLDRDLRDVVVTGGKVHVSKFRSAELLVLSQGGAIIERKLPPGSKAAAGSTRATRGRPQDMAASPVVGWRLRPLPDGKGVAMVHQESTNSELGTQQDGYASGPCKSPIGAAVTVFPEVGAPTSSAQLMFAVLPVDFAYSNDRKRLAVVAAGNANSSPGVVQAPHIYFMSTAMAEVGECLPPVTTPQLEPGEVPLEFRQPLGESVAIAFDGLGRLVVQTREPARLEILTHRGGTIKLSDDSRHDSGHALFHASTGSRLACASCHPEGGEDGRTWRFAKIGGRRTQDLRGGILETAPFHWDGEMRDMTHLMTEVFMGRMGGPKLQPEHVQAMARWIDRVPTLPQAAPGDAAAVARGKALFESPRVACATCHNGPTLTNNQTVNAGTGGPMQVPSLRGIADRAPYMHAGCAATLTERFASYCGGGDQHGVTSHLGKPEIDDLVAYLESL